MAAPFFAGVAQMVERQSSKLHVASSRLAARSSFIPQQHDRIRAVTF